MNSKGRRSLACRSRLLTLASGQGGAYSEEAYVIAMRALVHYWCMWEKENFLCDKRLGYAHLSCHPDKVGTISECYICSMASSFSSLPPVSSQGENAQQSVENRFRDIVSSRAVQRQCSLSLFSSVLTAHNCVLPRACVTLSRPTLEFQLDLQAPVACTAHGW